MVFNFDKKRDKVIRNVRKPLFDETCCDFQDISTVLQARALAVHLVEPLVTFQYEEESFISRSTQSSMTPEVNKLSLDHLPTWKVKLKIVVLIKVMLRCQVLTL